ncbi:MAG: DUF655 domain-containing protein [Thermoprotei archaeon]|nr:DUF655 domain-containing protein [Thermoprotei archaeon]
MESEGFERGPGRPQGLRSQHPAAVEVEGIIIDYIPQGLYNDPHKEHKDRPIAQAIGVRRFTLIDGIPLGDVEVLQRVTLARSVLRTIIQPIDWKGQKVKKSVVVLACLPGPEKIVYCYPLTPLDKWGLESLKTAIQEEGGWALLVDSPLELSRIAEDKGLPPSILVVPPSPLKYGELTDIAKSNLTEAVKAIIKTDERIYVEFFNIADAINVRLHTLELFKGVGKKVLSAFLERRRQKPFESFEEVKKVLKIDPLTALAEKISEEIRGEARYYLFIEPSSPDSPYLDYLSKVKRAYFRKSSELRSS